MFKYKLILNDSIQVFNRTLYRIKSLKDFGNVRSGDLGGYLESESNLSHDDNCWIYGKSQVFGGAKIEQDAQVLQDSMVFGKVAIYGNTIISKDSIIRGD